MRPPRGNSGSSNSGFAKQAAPRFLVHCPVGLPKMGARFMRVMRQIVSSGEVANPERVPEGGRQPER